ncbi:hypothetical protein [Novipirellula galeiformis]|nr:hypothetical protein [Novipirellula galeiformis]
METEQSIGSKRDDLRIEGFRTDEDVDETQIVLWTVEIKVAAPLHESSRQRWGEEGLEEPSSDPEMVSQLVNYDAWLAKQSVEYVGGFVLSIRNSSGKIPDGLTQTWSCITWTDLAMVVQDALADNLLPPTEHSFAEHMLGFIRNRLWDTTDMTTSRLELDDIALLRALAAIGPSCSQKVKDLARQFEQVSRDTGIEFVDIRTPTSPYFDRTVGIEHGVSARCVNNQLGEVSVSAKVEVDDVCVSISTYPKNCKAHLMVRDIFSMSRMQLSERNPDWVFFDPVDSDYSIAKISKPLVSVLAHEDWQAPLIDFVRDVLADLRDIGILESLVNLGAERDKSGAGQSFD